MKMVTIALSAVLVASSAFAQAKPKGPDVWPLVDEAAAFIKAGQLDKVEEKAAMILEADRSQPMGHTLLIWTLEKKGAHEAAIAACDALAKAFPVGPEVKKPDPLRRHQLWHYYAERHKGEAFFRLKRYGEAATCFEAAARLAYQAARPMDAHQTYRWQIQMKNRQADALWAAGKKEEAVALRKQIIAKFARDARAGNVLLRVNAALVTNLKALGRAKEANQVIAKILMDKRLDPVQYGWLGTRWTKDSPWQPPKADDKITARHAPGAFIIRSEGRFELRVNLATEQRYAMITSWYDLETDPLREVDLLDDNWFSIFKPHHLGQQELVDGKWKPIPYRRYVELRKAGKLGVGYTKKQNAFKVIENTPARVRFGYVNRSWPAETVTYTVYPDGRIYIGTHWTPYNADKTIKILRMGYYTGVSGTINWRTTIGKQTGMVGQNVVSGQTPFTMLHSNEHYPTALESTRADLAKCLVRPTSSYGNNTLFLAWFRTPVGVRFKPDEQPEVNEACFIHIWPNNRDTYEAALHYMQDYQTPAKLTVTTGTLVTDDPGDYNHDGFNEAEGCYVVRADANAVALGIDGSTVKRFSPIFKVLDVTGADHDLNFAGETGGEPGPASMHVDAKTKTAIVRLTHPVLSAGKLTITFK